MRKFAIAVLSLVVSVLALALPCSAADVSKWPEKPVELIWHSKAGSSGDQYLRALARFLEKKWNQTVIVSNVTGASGANAWNKVRKSKADGYTILGVSSTIVASPVVNKLPVNYQSFDPVARMFIDAIVIFVAGDSPYNTLADLVADAKKRPGELTFAGGTAGNLEFIGAREVMKAAGCKVSIVPFEGGSDGVISVVGGHVTAGVGEFAEILSAYKAGKVKILATFNKLTNENIPSVAESGYPEASIAKLRGIFLPKGVPAAIKEKVLVALKESMDDPDFQTFYKQNNLVPAFVEGEEFIQLLAKQTEQVKESLSNLKKK